jgi:hypothetical protein
MLSYLSVAHKVCGGEAGLRQPKDGSYAEAIQMLLDNGYGENIIVSVA